jgi:hypothetical protein
VEGGKGTLLDVLNTDPLEEGFMQKWEGLPIYKKMADGLVEALL